jgi:hypothetical protein
MQNKNESKAALALVEESIINKILIIRGIKVMIDSDLAKLYGVSTKRLNEQVKRNIKRFPEDFMFRISEEEKDYVVANCDHLKRLKFSPYLPYVFTEHGAVMLAGILNSDVAINANIQIVRAFIRMREVLSVHKKILQKLDQLQKNDAEQDEKITLIFEFIKQLEETKLEEADQKNRKRIGFKTSD